MPDKNISHWKSELEKANRRQEKFWRQGEKVNDRFRDDSESTIGGSNLRHLNLFHANVKTESAMLFGSIPKTDVSRRFADPNDDIARVAAEILQRLINTSIEAPGESDTEVLGACLQDRLLAGLGIARIHYTFETQDDIVFNEKAKVSYVYWKDFRWSFARIWSNVTWVAFDSYLTTDEVKARFGAAKLAKLQTSTTSSIAEDETPPGHKITEIWDKSSKCVYWLAEESDLLLDKRDDPLRLEGFFPCPPPMAANTTTTVFTPKSDYAMAQDLYNDIDLLTQRISIISRAVKVVGVYNAESTEIKRMLQEGVDNDLIPASNWGMFSEKGGLAGQIDWMPLKEIVEALRQLQALRDEKIDLLYQITGMSDILRGQSDPYTGVGQDKIKAKYASIRIQLLEDRFARFCSQLMRLRAEIISRHFSPESIALQSSVHNFQEDPMVVMKALELIQSDSDFWLWKIEIKPESIAMADYAQIKADRTEFLTALGSFLNSSMAAGESAPQFVPFLLELMRWALAGFKGSQQIEGVLDQAIQAANEAAQNPEQTEENPKIAEIQAKAAAEQQKQEHKAALEMEKLKAAHHAKISEILTESKADISIEQVQALLNAFETEIKARFDQELERLRQMAPQKT